MSQSMEVSYQGTVRERRAVIVCPLCISLFEDPVSLPCHHVFCRQCIQTWRVQTSVNVPLESVPSGTISPVCAQPWTAVSPSNVAPQETLLTMAHGNSRVAEVSQVTASTVNVSSAASSSPQDSGLPFTCPVCASVFHVKPGKDDIFTHNVGEGFKADDQVLTLNSGKAMTHDSVQAMTPVSGQSMTPDTGPVLTPDIDRVSSPDTGPVLTPNSKQALTPDNDQVSSPESDPVLTPDNDQVSSAESDPVLTPNSDKVLTVLNPRAHAATGYVHSTTGTGQSTTDTVHSTTHSVHSAGGCMHKEVGPDGHVPSPPDQNPGLTAETLIPDQVTQGIVWMVSYGDWRHPSTCQECHLRPRKCSCRWNFPDCKVCDLKPGECVCRTCFMSLCLRCARKHKSRNSHHRIKDTRNTPKLDVGLDWRDLVPMPPPDAPVCDGPSPIGEDEDGYVHEREYFCFDCQSYLCHRCHRDWEFDWKLDHYHCRDIGNARPGGEDHAKLVYSLTETAVYKGIDLLLPLIKTYVELAEKNLLVLGKKADMFRKQLTRLQERTPTTCKRPSAIGLTPKVKPIAEGRLRETTTLKRPSKVVSIEAKAGGGNADDSGSAVDDDDEDDQDDVVEDKVDDKRKAHRVSTGSTDPTIETIQRLLARVERVLREESELLRNNIEWCRVQQENVETWFTVLGSLDIGNYTDVAVAGVLIIKDSCVSIFHDLETNDKLLLQRLRTVVNMKLELDGLRNQKGESVCRLEILDLTAESRKVHNHRPAHDAKEDDAEGVASFLPDAHEEGFSAVDVTPRSDRKLALECNSRIKNMKVARTQKHSFDGVGSLTVEHLLNTDLPVVHFDIFEQVDKVLFLQ